MVEDNKGEYQPAETFPDFPYQFDITKSSCVDINGYKILEALLYDEEKKEVQITTTKRTTCYLYFSNPKEAFATSLINSGELWQSGLDGDGYRYTGSGNYDSDTTPNNFICFGPTDKTTCKGNESKYLYRIIGVFADSSNNQHVKLISFKQLMIAAWNDTDVDIDWGSSTLFTSLNGSGFLTNSTYDYLQNSTWLNKIENWQ